MDNNSADSKVKKKNEGVFSFCRVPPYFLEVVCELHREHLGAFL